MQEGYKAEVRKKLKDFLGDKRWIKVIEHKNKCEDIPDSSILTFMNVFNKQKKTIGKVEL